MSRPQRPFGLALALTAGLVLTSCSQTSSPAANNEGATAADRSATSTSASASATVPSASPKSASASPSSPAGRRIDITVRGKQVRPEPATVNIAVGESLTIAVTSDRDNTLHAHGFEIAKDVKAGKRAEIKIKGAESGVFEFELHDPALRLLQVAVR